MFTFCIRYRIFRWYTCSIIFRKRKWY